MKLREILEKCQINVADMEKSMSHDDRQMLNWEVVVHEAGEQADEVVHVELVPEIHSIYLEYE